MIRRVKGELAAECDDCGHDTEGVVNGFRNFQEFVAALKDHGWIVRKDDDSEWTHRCSEECSG